MSLFNPAKSQMKQQRNTLNVKVPYFKMPQRPPNWEVALCLESKMSFSLSHRNMDIIFGMMFEKTFQSQKGSVKL